MPRLVAEGNKGRYVYVRATKVPGVRGSRWGDKLKRQAFELWLSGLSMSKISAEISVPVPTLSSWRQQDWWKTAHREALSEDNQLLDSRLSKNLNLSLDKIQETLEKGESVYDKDTGKIKQVPVKLRDATAAFNATMQARRLVRNEPTKITEDSGVQSQLLNLANQFRLFVNKPIEEKLITNYIEGEVVHE